MQGRLEVKIIAKICKNDVSTYEVLTNHMVNSRNSNINSEIEIVIYYVGRIVFKTPVG